LNQENEPATSKQRTTIARLGIILGIKEPIAEGTMTMAQAGRQIRHLYYQTKLKRRRNPPWIRR